MKESFMSFLSGLWKWFCRYLMGVGLVITILGIWGSSWMKEQASPLPKEGPMILRLSLEGEIRQEASSGSLWQKILEGYRGKKPGPYLPDLRSQLLKAKDDPRVKGLFISMDSLGGSLASFEELHGLIALFKESQKPVHFWTSSLDTKIYLLASLADKISVPPLAHTMLFGPSFTMTYLGRALEKLGVRLEVLRAGDFKSLGEPFLQNTMGEKTREMYESLEKSLRDHLVDRMGRNREVDLEDARGWLEDGLFLPEEALEKGLLDSVVYQDEAEHSLKEELEADLYDMEDYSWDEIRGSKKEDGFALIEAVGEIRMDSDGSRGFITPKHLNEELTWAMENDRVKGVLLKIDSPGGSALASDLIWQKVDQLAKKKPTVVLMGGVAASGGYYIAAPGTKIFALPTTITGSIGVVGLFPNLSQFEEKYGVSFPLVTGNRHRGILSPGEGLSPEDRKSLEAGIGDSYKKFIQKVADGRHMEVEKIHGMAQGRVWTGSQAQALGLVDALGGFHEGVVALKELLTWDPKKDYPLYRWEPQVYSVFECLVDGRHFPQCLGEGSSLGENFLSRSQDYLISLGKDPIQAIWWDGIFYGQSDLL
jgi:protease-4